MAWLILRIRNRNRLHLPHRRVPVKRTFQANQKKASRQNKNKKLSETASEINRKNQMGGGIYA